MYCVHLLRADVTAGPASPVFIARSLDTPGVGGALFAAMAVDAEAALRLARSAADGWVPRGAGGAVAARVCPGLGAARRAGGQLARVRAAPRGVIALLAVIHDAVTTTRCRPHHALAALANTSRRLGLTHLQEARRAIRKRKRLRGQDPAACEPLDDT
eukprot:scaffold162168_cov25-Tisochrysis_lutea.AAC.3